MLFGYFFSGWNHISSKSLRFFLVLFLFLLFNAAKGFMFLCVHHRDCCVTVENPSGAEGVGERGFLCCLKFDIFVK